MLIIAPCSSKKQVFITPELEANSIQAIDLEEFSQKWAIRVHQAKDTYRSTNVYAGIGVSASKSAAAILKAELHFLSAGMSLINSSKLIPGYNLTISNKGPTPFTQVKKSGTPQIWWNSLNKAFGYKTPLINIISEHAGPVFIALPSNYLTMIEDELTKAIKESSKKVRVITSSSTDINPTLASVAIRYDQRLNTMSNGPSGANASFVQRALLNFSRTISKHSAEHEPVTTQQALVNDSFKDIDSVRKVKRLKVSEGHLFTIIQSALANENVSSNKLLENLRRFEGIACEQTRFKRLYEQALKLRA
jgi:hypothetical protein